MENKIIAVDFDGTLCENRYPQIGKPNREMIDYIKKRQQDGAKIVLWTCRIDELLDDAVRWSRNQGLIFDAVNENMPEIIAEFGTDTRKIFANEYIDDRNVPLSSCREKSGMQMIESLLKDLGERHFEVLCRYEVLTNSIVIKMDKRSGHQWHSLVRKFTFDDFCHLKSNQFEFIMVQFLKEMAQELEYQIHIAREPMKGENE